MASLNQRWRGVGCPIALLPLVVALFSASASAHQLKFTETELRWRPNQQRLEVTHTVHLDDAMALLAQIGEPAGDLDIAAEARLLHYVGQHFAVGHHGEPVELTAVGAQIEGDYLWIYQERAMPVLLQGLEVRCDLLWDLFADAQNQVNFRVGDEVRTLRFGAGQDMGRFDPL